MKATTLTEAEIDRRAEGRMLRKWAHSAGLCYKANPRRQVVHLGIHDHGKGCSLTFTAEQFRDLIRKLLGVDIKTIRHLREAANHAPDLFDRLAIIEMLTSGTKATHVHRVAREGVRKARGVRPPAESAKGGA